MSADVNAHDWIVLPLLPNRDAWVARLHEAASAAGRVLHDWDQSQELNAAARPILVTASAEAARAGQPDASRIAAIVDALDVAMPADAAPPERHHRLQAATDSFAQIAVLPKERVFGPGRFAGGAVDLFPDLRASAPAASPSPSGPVAEALRLYTEGQAHWPGALLTWNTAPTHEAGQSSFDLTGRPRIVIYGPYLVMPAGRWKAVFTLSFDDYASRYLFRTDWGGVQDYASQEFRPGRAGVFELEMIYDWAERGACEFRLLVLEGVFHGRVSVSDLTVSRVD